jgi:hypothetical protein
MELAPIKEFLSAAPLWVKLFGWGAVVCVAVVLGAYLTLGNEYIKSKSPSLGQDSTADSASGKRSPVEKPILPDQINANASSDGQSGGQTAGIINNNTIINNHLPQKSEKAEQKQQAKSQVAATANVRFSDEEINIRLKIVEEFYAVFDGPCKEVEKLAMELRGVPLNSAGRDKYIRQLNLITDTANLCYRRIDAIGVKYERYRDIVQRGTIWDYGLLQDPIAASAMALRQAIETVPRDADPKLYDLLSYHFAQFRNGTEKFSTWVGRSKSSLSDRLSNGIGNAPKAGA